MLIRTGRFFRTHFPTFVRVAAKLGPAEYEGREKSAVMANKLHFLSYSVNGT